MGINKKTPAIRFQGFEEEWEEKKLGEVVDIRSGKDYKHLSSGNIPVYGTGGYMLSVNEALSYKENAVGIGRKGTIDKPYILNAPFWTVDTLFFAVPRPNKDLYFIYDIFQRINWKQKDESTGIPSLSKTSINAVDILVSSTTEQTKIGNYFKELDSLIQLQEQKLEKVTNLKKAMLEKMFPKENADVPEIRFEGFTEKWEKKKLGDIVSISSASRVHKNEWTTSGVPFFRSSDVVSFYKGLDNTKAYISYDLYLKLSSVSGAVKKDDILITGGGSIGIPYLIDSDAPLYFKDADLLWVKNTSNVHGYFLYTFFLTRFFRNYLQSITHIGTISHYTIEQARVTPITLPDVLEQQKIGQYFQNLDQLINQSKQKIDQLKHLKQALLQKMFI